MLSPMKNIISAGRMQFSSKCSKMKWNTIEPKNIGEFLEMKERKKGDRGREREPKCQRCCWTRMSKMQHWLISIKKLLPLLFGGHYTWNDSITHWNWVSTTMDSAAHYMPTINWSLNCSHRSALPLSHSLQLFLCRCGLLCCTHYYARAFAWCIIY